MLNGKFFTGLPPKMMDRVSTGGHNRLESNLFWPDDTQVDTAVESRIKRRNSMQVSCKEKPLYEKQNSTVDDDVDTKRRFNKEFSQSSIQFCDNLNENQSNSRRIQQRNSVANKKMEIADKPTNTKLELPDGNVNEAYTAAKKKQAYTSKIEFYDYVNEREEPKNNRNNLRKPKMDMNDKREMELNSKNSPKLQVKRDVRSLSEEKEQAKINNREVRANERATRQNMNNYYDQRERFTGNEDNYLRGRRSVEPRMNVSPKRVSSKITPRKPEHLSNESYQPAYNDYGEERDNRRDAEELGGRFSPRDYDNLDDNSFYRRKQEQPTRMIKNNTRRYYDSPEDTNYNQKYKVDEEIKNRMKNVGLRSPSPRKDYYKPEEYYDDKQQSHYDRNNQVKTPTYCGSSHRSLDRENNDIDLSFKNWNNNATRFNTGDNLSVNKINNRIQQEKVATAVSPPPSDTESSVSATKSLKHLRSSLCFNNGEIIGENDAPTSSSSSSQHQTQRRNARSSATQRVSVGLPD